jgi:ABC-type glycerol-3-phosphate transport system permease component
MIGARSRLDGANSTARGIRLLRQENWLRHVVLILLLVCALFPLYIMIVMSLRPTALIYADFWGLPLNPVLDNYQIALGDLLMPLLRTLLVSAVSILGILVTAVPCAYALVRLNFVGRRILFYAILVLMIIPGTLLLTPHFILANQLNLRYSLLGLMVFYIAGGQPFAVFLLSSFLQAQPREIFEAARIDGAAEWQSMLYMAVPLALPILVTIAIMNFLGFYGDLIWPSLMLRSDQSTLILALQSFDPPMGQFGSRPNLGVQAAGYVVAVIPQLLLFAFGMKYFVQGLTSGSIKA